MRINILIGFLFLVTLSLESQDSLSVDILKEISYEFDVVGGKVIGSGATFIEEETFKAQFTMLGEYHGSKRISELTSGLIPILHKNGYGTIALEVGPISVQVLKELCSDSYRTVKNLMAFNEKYAYEDDYTAIPFFKSEEDARFLQKASEYNWNLIGIDQEFIYSYEMLIQRLYENLNKDQKVTYNDQYVETLDSVKQYIKDDDQEIKRFSIAVKESVVFQKFLFDMEIIPCNKEIVHAIRKTTEIYRLNAMRRWSDNNKARVLYMKENLRKGLNQSNFEIGSDKLFIKMGAYHLSKGMSPLGFYEVGNTLNELAEYHGNTALNIAFVNRFLMQDGEIVDILESQPNYAYKRLAALGRKSGWVVIDLRELQEGLDYYPLKYKVNKKMKALINRFDLVMIPPPEVE